jgi:hypothetical protein
MKYFVVALSPINEVQSKLITAQFTGKAWWHWIDNFWLVVDSSDTASCASIRDELHKIVPTARKIVLAVDPIKDGWAGAGPRTPQDMFEWVIGHWPKE